MPTVLRADTADELFVRVARELLENGRLSRPRGLETLELVNVWLTLSKPSEAIVTIPERGIDLDYLKGELAWYLSGDLRVESIAQHSSFWSKLADPNGTINSNYGFLALIEKHAGMSQYEWCVRSLKDDIDSRQAVIVYNQPRHKYVGNKDFVCTLSQQFMVRDGRLDTMVHMRSNDLIYGLSYDLPWFTLLQERIAKDVGVVLGEYHHFANSLHVYKKHFMMLEAIAQRRID